MKRRYHSLLTKPIDLFCTNALVYSSVESFHYFHTYLNWPLSIIITTASFRLFLHPLGMYFDKMNWKLPKVLQQPFENIHKSLLLNDLEMDAKKLNLNSDDLKDLQGKIGPAVLIRQMVQAYFCLNFARGLSDITLNSRYHIGIDDPIFWFWSLSSIDPFFVAPLVSGFATYKFLKGSFHPFTVPLTENLKFWGSFCVSLGFVPLPLSYSLSYWTFLLTHIVLRKLRSR